MTRLPAPLAVGARSMPTSTGPAGPVLLAVDQQLGERTASCPTQRARTASYRLVRPHERRTQAVVKKSHILDIGVARFVSPRMVRHLRFGGQTRDAVSGKLPVAANASAECPNGSPSSR